MQALRRATAGLSCGLALALAAGCASPPLDVGKMTAQDLSLPRHGGTVEVRVDGAVEVTDRILPQSFHEALVASLRGARVFSEVVEPPHGDYRLQVVLGDLKQEPAGAVTVVEMTTLWTLWRGDERVARWQSLVPSARTRGGSALSRKQVATEMAVQDNIREGITQLAGADLGD